MVHGASFFPKSTLEVANKSPLVSKYQVNLLTILSIVLHRQLVNAISLNFLGSVSSFPVFGIGMMNDYLHISGNLPFVHMLLYIFNNSCGDLLGNCFMNL